MALVCVGGGGCVCCCAQGLTFKYAPLPENIQPKNVFELVFGQRRQHLAIHLQTFV